MRIQPNCIHDAVAERNGNTSGVPSQAARYPEGILSWRHFGESGKNFIEIGKRPEIQETMLRFALPLETDGISQRRRINAKAQTWKKKSN